MDLDPKIKLAVSAAGVGIAVWGIRRLEHSSRRSRAVREFVAKHHLGPAGKRHGAICYEGTVRSHRVELLMGAELELRVKLETPPPPGFHAFLRHAPTPEQLRLWARHGEMEQAYFDHYAELRADHPTELKDYLTDRRKKALRRLLWLQHTRVEGTHLIYKKFGSFSREETLEQIMKMMLDSAIPMELEF